MLTLPIVIIYAVLGKIEKYIESLSDLNKSIEMYETLNVAQKISYLLMYLNHSVNFFIYFSTSARYRRIFFTDYFCDIKCKFQLNLRNFFSRKRLNRQRNQKDFLYA